jgi:serine/threonine protein kinase, bacterial
MPLGEGRTFAGYTIVRKIGAGGMGTVYLAQHPRLPRNDALKLLEGNVSADPSFRERFLREADLASTLWHPHIVGVHDRGEYRGQLWISMDFVDGADAGSLMARRYPAGMPQDLVTVIITAVASALDYAHKQGLLHRDVKPPNILLTNIDSETERRILLTDFGIARTIDDVSGLTATNTTVGTIAYTAPEQLMGEDIDGRADQYSLGATAYHLLTGSPPFPGSNPAVVISRHLNTAPPALAATRPDLAALDHVLAAALAKDPNYRFASCTDFARALTAQASGYGSPTPAAPTTPAPVKRPPAAPRSAQPPQVGNRTTPWLWILGVAAVLVVLGTVLFVWSQNKGSSSTSAPTTGATVSTAPYPTSEIAPPPSRTVTRTVTQSAFPPPVIVPTQQIVTAIIVGTCDEGGSCGVQQRTLPKTGAPRLYPDDLQDGTMVTLRCQTTGDLRSSAGHGSSYIWYRLINGAYVNSVYMTTPTTELPAC